MKQAPHGQCGGGRRHFKRSSTRVAIVALRDCTNFIGRTLIIPTPPSVRTARDVVFVPPGNGPSWGLFEPSGRAVPESIPYAGRPGSLHHAQGSLDCAHLPGYARQDPSLDYVYMGNVVMHYGHFLIGPLARLWAIPTFRRRQLRIVFSSNTSLNELMTQDFILTLVSALGLTAENFLQCTEPTRFDHIEVAACPFEELSLVHNVFADMMNGIGRQVSICHDRVVPRRMVYMSKECLPNGNVTIDNETEITAILRRNGVDVLFPEALPLEEQIKLWATDPIVMGFSGSAMHTSVFFPRRTTLVVAHGPDMWVNQVLIDRVNRNQSRYVYDEAGCEPIGPGRGFNMNYRIRDPRAFATSLLNIASGLARSDDP